MPLLGAFLNSLFRGYKVCFWYAKFCVNTAAGLKALACKLITFWMNILGKKIFIFWLNMTGHSPKISMKTYLPDLGKFVMIHWIKESRKSSSMSLYRDLFVNSYPAIRSSIVRLLTPSIRAMSLYVKLFSNKEITCVHKRKHSPLRVDSLHWKLNETFKRGTH